MVANVGLGGKRRHIPGKGGSLPGKGGGLQGRLAILPVLLYSGEPGMGKVGSKAARLGAGKAIQSDWVQKKATDFVSPSKGQALELAATSISPTLNPIKKEGSYPS